MRYQLDPFLGQEIIYIGRRIEAVRNPQDDTLNLCLKNVRIWPLRMDVPLKTIKPVRVDHVWLPHIAEDQIRGEMLELSEGAAVVQEYTRADGSIDLGLKPVNGCSDGIFYEKLRARKKRSEQKEAIAWFLDQIQSGFRFWGWGCSANTIIDILKERLVDITKSDKLSAAALKTSKRNGKCNRLKDLDIRPQSKRSKHRASGFSTT